jgi:nitrous oxidase accessory protein NosD
MAVAAARDAVVKRRVSMRNVAAVLGVALVVFAVSTSSVHGQLGARRASPFDAAAIPLSLPSAIVPTVPFLLGQVDLSSIGVADSELVTVGPAAASSTSSSPMLIVDDDGANCPNAQFTSVQAAVTAAMPGDTIKVCPGTYVEQVTIPAGKDNLTLFSEGAFQAILKAPPVMADPKAIVWINGAHDVTLRHFTIAGPGGTACDSIRYGVRVDAGGSALITDNHITEIHDTPFGGCQNGVGVLVGRNADNTSGSARVVHNLIDRYQKGGVVVDGTATSRSTAEVAYNEITGVGATPIVAQNGIQVSRNAVADVHHNRVSLNNFSLPTFSSEAILLFQENGRTTVHHNYVFLNDDGIGLFTTTDTGVSHNRSERNDFDGIFADTDTAGNTISYNRAQGNQLFDCEDDSTGPGTAGTANFWINNLGDTANRPGLCKATPK